MRTLYVALGLRRWNRDLIKIVKSYNYLEQVRRFFLEMARLKKTWCLPRNS